MEDGGNTKRQHTHTHAAQHQALGLRPAQCGAQLHRAVRRKLDRETENFTALGGRLLRLHPRRKINDSLQRLDDLQTGLLRNVKTAVRARQLQWENLAGRFWRARPTHAVKLRREALRQLEKRLLALGPEQVLARGYSITTDAASGRVVRAAAAVQPGQILRTRTAQGEITSRATE